MEHCPHIKGLLSEPDFGTNPCSEISLGEDQDCVLPFPDIRPQTKGLQTRFETVVAGHIHHRVPTSTSISEPGIHPVFTGNIYSPILKYNEGRS